MASTTTIHTTPRYPGWKFQKTVDARGREEWFGTKEGVGYAVSGIMHKGQVYGELMTRRKGITGSIAWEPIANTRNPFEGTMAECIAEAERRAAYWASKGEKDAYGEYLKN